MGGLVVAGDRSGSGKTTVTLALLAALRARGATVQAFKVGPDYIDPMFHRAVTGRPAYNLDPVLTSEAYVQQCFQQHQQDAQYALIEGVMGLFDGAGGTDWGSTAHVARLIDRPILLVVDCARLSRSLAAIVYGYQMLDPRIRLAGVVLNQVGSDRHLTMLKAALEPLGIPVLGVLRREEAITLPDRHLGLVPTDELPDLPQRVQHLAALGQRCFDWAHLEPWLRGDAPAIAPSPDPPVAMPPVRLGIARDRAFSFYYEDNLRLLTTLGAELVPWSPLGDRTLPLVDGLYVGGGFPEMFAPELAENAPLRAAVAEQIAAGLPTYAECGGLMYLCQTLVDFEQRSWAMVGALPTTVTMTGRLTLGYRQGRVARDGLLAEADQTFWGHEFHRSTLTAVPPEPLYRLQSYPLAGTGAIATETEGWGTPTLHASYLHLHWGSHPALPRRFLTRCQQFRTARPQ